MASCVVSGLMSSANDADRSRLGLDWVYAVRTPRPFPCPNCSSSSPLMECTHLAPPPRRRRRPRHPSLQTHSGVCRASPASPARVSASLMKDRSRAAGAGSWQLTRAWLCFASTSTVLTDRTRPRGRLLCSPWPLCGSQMRPYRRVLRFHNLHHPSGLVLPAFVYAWPQRLCSK